MVSVACQATIWLAHSSIPSGGFLGPGNLGFIVPPPPLTSCAPHSGGDRKTFRGCIFKEQQQEQMLTIMSGACQPILNVGLVGQFLIQLLLVFKSNAPMPRAWYCYVL